MPTYWSLARISLPSAFSLPRFPVHVLADVMAPWISFLSPSPRVASFFPFCREVPLLLSEALPHLHASLHLPWAPCLIITISFSFVFSLSSGSFPTTHKQSGFSHHCGYFPLAISQLRFWDQFRCVEVSPHPQAILGHQLGVFSSILTLSRGSVRFHWLRTQSYKTTPCPPLQMPIISPGCYLCF